MEAARARHHGWLDAQHDSAARHRRETHGNPQNLQCAFVQNLRCTNPPSRIGTEPQNREFVKAALYLYADTDIHVYANPYIHKSVIQANMRKGLRQTADH